MVGREFRGNAELIVSYLVYLLKMIGVETYSNEAFVLKLLSIFKIVSEEKVLPLEFGVAVGRNFGELHAENVPHVRKNASVLDDVAFAIWPSEICHFAGLDRDGCRRIYPSIDHSLDVEHVGSRVFIGDDVFEEGITCQLE